jgi:hypothetical protein
MYSMDNEDKVALHSIDKNVSEINSRLPSGIRKFSDRLWDIFEKAAIIATIMGGVTVFEYISAFFGGNK